MKLGHFVPNRAGCGLKLSSSKGRNIWQNSYLSIKDDPLIQGGARCRRQDDLASHMKRVLHAQSHARQWHSGHTWYLVVRVMIV